MGGFVAFAVLVLVLACALVGVVGLQSFTLPPPPEVFSVVGVIGLVAVGLGMMAIGDQSLQGTGARLEPGFYLLALAFIVLTFAPGVESWLEQGLPHSSSPSHHL